MQWEGGKRIKKCITKKEGENVWEWNHIKYGCQGFYFIFFYFLFFSQVLVSKSFLILFYVSEGITFHLLVSENMMLVESLDKNQ